jgi:hypothetical protein
MSDSLESMAGMHYFFIDINVGIVDGVFGWWSCGDTEVTSSCT